MTADDLFKQADQLRRALKGDMRDFCREGLAGADLATLPHPAAWDKNNSALAARLGMAAQLVPAWHDHIERVVEVLPRIDNELTRQVVTLRLCELMTCNEAARVICCATHTVIRHEQLAHEQLRAAMG